MLTKAQQAHIDDAFARVGKPSAALQLKIDQLRAAKTEGEVITILLKDADVVRSKIETDLLCLVAMIHQLELKEEQCNAENSGKYGKENSTLRRSPPTRGESL